MASLPQHPASRSAPDPEARLSGIVERVTFQSEANGFCVLRVKVKGQRDLMTVVGNCAAIAPGELIECHGEWHNDRVHGLQYQAEHIRTVPPTTLEGIEKYLGSGLVRGIGPHFAKKLVRGFGTEVLTIIETAPEQLLTLDGIGPKRLKAVTSAWSEQKRIREIMVFLHGHGVGTSRAVRIYKTYGDDAVAKVRKNPYRLALDIHGIGFKTADALAQRLGIPSDSLIRSQAGVRHALQTLTDAGHCAARRQPLAELTVKLLEIPEALAEQAIDAELAENNLVSEAEEGNDVVYLAPLYHAESGCARHLKRLAAGAPPWGEIDEHKAIPWAESATGIRLSPSQHQAVRCALRHKVTLLTGGPGVGKTTIVRCILRLIATRCHQILLCAPTGRAAKRLSESIGKAAKTVHRLLEFDPNVFAFKRNAEQPLDAELVVIDETSMLDVVLMNQLLRAVPDHAGVLIVGDVDQLPSVGPGAVLKDMIESGSLATVRLTEIFRQAKASQIIVNAHRINHGLQPNTSEPGTVSDFYWIPAENPEDVFKKLIEVVTQRIPRRFQLDPVRAIQVLTPMNRGGLGATALNIELQQRLNPARDAGISRYGSVYAPGDKVIQRVNDYDKEVFNGDIGFIQRVTFDDESVSVDFDGRDVSYGFGDLDELSLAYATSVHKSQGSEYPAVVIPLALQHYKLLERNLLYTGVTRGKQLVVLIGEPKALTIAVKNQRAPNRLTRLAICLREDMQTVEVVKAERATAAE